MVIVKVFVIIFYILDKHHLLGIHKYLNLNKYLQSTHYYRPLSDYFKENDTLAHYQRNVALTY